MCAFVCTVCVCECVCGWAKWYKVLGCARTLFRLLVSHYKQSDDDLQLTTTPPQHHAPPSIRPLWATADSRSESGHAGGGGRQGVAKTEL